MYQREMAKELQEDKSFYAHNGRVMLEVEWTTGAATVSKLYQILLLLTPRPINETSLTYPGSRPAVKSSILRDFALRNRREGAVQELYEPAVICKQGVIQNNISSSCNQHEESDVTYVLAEKCSWGWPSWTYSVDRVCAKSFACVTLLLSILTCNARPASSSRKLKYWVTLLLCAK